MTKVKGRVLKHNDSTRIMHWINLVCFILLAVTGMGFYFKSAIVSNVFGGAVAASILHRFAAVLFTINPIIYIIVNFEGFAKFVDTSTTITRNDIGWLKKMGGYIKYKDNIPPQDKYNAGQKFFTNLVISGCLLFIITGFPMWLGRHAMSPLLVKWCYSLHFWDAVIMVLAITGHFYLAAINSKSRGELRSMMADGYVDADFTAHHNKTWFDTLEKINAKACTQSNE